MKQLLTLVYLFIFSFTLYPQSPVSMTSADMYQALRQLNVLGSVLYIAAHPDDENTRLISWLTRDKMYRTGYLSLTRGDGGQNLIGEEQGIELGLIRTQELLAARRVDGGEQFFTRAFDFGYSKNPDETFRKWDKEKILADVVWVIRRFHPDIIITRFPTTGEGGHGHHTASAILANEAFTAAADPARFPEQLKYVTVWQAKRVLWNTFNFGGNNTIREDQFRVDVGGYNPLLGKSYGEIAAESRSQHKSQGFGVPASRGESWEYFKATRGDQPTKELLESIDQTWNRVPGGQAVALLLDSVIAGFNLMHPEAAVKDLVRLYQRMEQLPDHYWKQQKMKELQALITQCSGLFMEAVTTEQLAVQTDSLKISINLNNRLGADAKWVRAQIEQIDTVLNRSLQKNRNAGLQQNLFIPLSKPVTQPYWLQQPKQEGYFEVADQLKIGIPDVEPAFTVQLTLEIAGQEFQYTIPVQYKFTDPVKGELYQPVVVVPPVLLSPRQDMVLVTRDRNQVSGNLLLKSLKQGLQGEVQLRITGEKENNAQLKLQQASFLTAARDQASDVSFSGTVPGQNAELGFYIRSSLYNDEAADKHEIRHVHIPWINYFHKAVVPVRYVDLKTENKRIGYITGAGDKVPEALEQMGYEVVLLGDKELTKNNLLQYDALLTGVRAYNTHAWLNKHYDKLMKYVQEGGNLIVQYNTSNQIGPVRAKIGPVPFVITRNRVTDENAPVSMLKPEHPVFSYPNKITADDFRGWIQERSIYHASDTSGKFDRLLAMADLGEKSDNGSLITLKYGKGWFTYTGVVFFRELPAGVSGAYRLLANLIALNRKKGF